MSRSQESAAGKTAKRKALLALGAGGVALLIVMGATLVVVNWHAASTDTPHILTRYSFGARGEGDVVANLRDALHADLWVILGYFMVFAGLSVVLMHGALSEFGKLMGRLMAGAAAAAALSDLAENALLWRSHEHPGVEWLVTAATVAATLKWCAVLAALMAVVPALWVIIRLAWVFLADAWSRLKAARSKTPRTPWWDEVLAKQDQLPATVSDAVRSAHQSTVDAYSVPGTQKVIQDRINDRKPVTALCLSGGGIRSACVAMGAMQALSKQHDATVAGSSTALLDDVDYVISVSGGGYSAGARLLAVEGAKDVRLSDRFGEGSVEFEHLRRRSSYIADTPAEMLRALGEVVKNLLASMTTLFAWAVALGLLFGWGLAKLPIAAWVPARLPSAVREREPGSLTLLNHTAVASLAVAVIAGFAVLATAIALFIEVMSAGKRGEKWRERFAAIARAAGLFAVLVLTVTVALPALMWACSPPADTRPDKSPAMIIGGAAGVVVLQLVSSLVTMMWKAKNGATAQRSSWFSSVRKVLPRGLFRLMLVLVTLGILITAWLLALGIVAARVFRDTVDPRSDVLPGDLRIWVGVSLGIIVLSILADVTSMSLHPFYRLRLARAFDVRRVENKGHVEAEGYEDAEPTWLDKYGRLAGVTRPRFVFAAAAAISGGSGGPPPGFKAVSYTLDADHIGGPELGWLNTTKLRHVAPPRIQRDLTVQAAVAVSGAAFGSAMGRMSTGLQTLLAASGARLGTWLPNPRFVIETKTQREAGVWTWPALLPKFRGASYLFRELFGVNHKMARLAQITDGGHYENLGLVEALRRRCQLIICIDGSGDTPPLMGGLASAMALAKSELGVDIVLEKSGEFSVNNLAPGSGRRFGTTDPFGCLNDRITRGAVVRGTVHYPDAAGLYGRRPDGTGLQERPTNGETGPVDRSTATLIVAKAVLWRECPYWLLTYAAEHGNEIFPNDKTADQWFSDDQFAAYTELGRLVGAAAVGAIAEPPMVEVAPDNSHRRTGASGNGARTDSRT